MIGDQGHTKLAGLDAEEFLNAVEDGVMLCHFANKIVGSCKVKVKTAEKTPLGKFTQVDMPTDPPHPNPPSLSLSPSLSRSRSLSLYLAISRSLSLYFALSRSTSLYLAISIWRMLSIVPALALVLAIASTSTLMLPRIRTR